MQNSILHDFMLKILSTNSSNSSNKTFKDIYNILKYDLKNIVVPNSPPDFFDILTNLTDELKDFEYASFFGEIFLHNRIILAGAFSSGKSSFVNTILEKKVLPSGIDPSTSIPTYILQDKNFSINCINIFDSFFEITDQNLNMLSYKKDAENNFSGNINHLIQKIVIKTPKLPLKFSMLVDTPGYDITNNYSNSNVDINKSSLIIWFISCDVGTLTQMDLISLKKIDKNIPILIIINKVDKLLYKQLQMIIYEIQNILNDNFINFVDILLFSSRNPLDYDFVKIIQIIKSYDKKILNQNFFKQFKLLFNKIYCYYNKVLFDYNLTISSLNFCITFTDDDSVITTLLPIIKNIKSIMSDIDNIKREIFELETAFFTKLLEISKKNNLDFLKFDSIKSIDYLSNNYLHNVFAYKKLNAIKNNFELYKIINKFYTTIEADFEDKQNLINILFPKSNFVNNVFDTINTLPTYVE